METGFHRWAIFAIF